MIVLGNDEFAEGVAKKMNADFAKLETKKFPDGEYYLRILEPGRLKGKKVIFVSRGRTPGLSQDRLLTKSLLVLFRLAEVGAKKIGLFLPYMPYSRQDKEFLPGEVVSVNIFRKILEDKCDLIVSVTNHDKREEGWVDRKFYNIDGTGAAIEFLKTKKFANPFVAAPDMTSKGNVEEIAKAIGGSVLALRKERDRKTGGVKTSGEMPDLTGKEIIFFDDIASSGGTLMRAIEKAKKANADKIICVVVHVLDVHNEIAGKNSIDMIKEACDEYYASDTIENPVEGFSIVGQVAEFFKKNF
ncbi:MAG: ribose-phosphate diphosphokinase [Candidatus Aenigmatarchaeota archaeon]|nr:MAG: ribose-phosphate diphosphokinase [Candidatus Aenigmarchaeota archaeon]